MMKGLIGWGEKFFGGVLCFLWLSAVSVLAQVSPPGDPGPQVLVGELSGEFSVNNLGAFNYSVPLAISPGTAGVEPKLSISYSSRNGNGLLGLGFSLGGLSKITRAGTSLDQDGFIDGVDFDENDRFLLDGQRLEVVGPSTNKIYYGTAESEYRTELNSFSRVVAHGQAGNGPAWFEVWTKSGLIYEYGHTTNSAFMPGSHTNVLSWSVSKVSKVSDTVGNYMTFTYTTHSSEPIIERIDYTGRAGLAPYNAVEFEYEGRPDPSLRYFMGAKMEQTNRLAKIIMQSNGIPMHEYHLSYTNSAAGQSLLASFQQVFEGGDSLPETRFEYGGTSVATNFNYSGGWDVFKEGTQRLKSFISAQDRCLEGDFNGDGRMDVCSLGPGYNNDLWLGLSNGDGTFAFTIGTNFLRSDLATQVGYGGCSVFSGDFNGDGLTDIGSVGDFADERWVGLSQGDGTFVFSSGDDVLPSSLEVYNPDETAWAVYAGDFNGDGLADICSLGHEVSERWLGLSNGDGTFDFTNRTGYDLLPAHLDSHFFPGGSTIRTGDFNGDGRMDVFSVGPVSTSWGELRWLGLATTNGTFYFTFGTNLFPAGLRANTYWVDDGDPTVFDKGCVVETGDFNGDGLTDVCSLGDYSGQTWLGLSSGTGTFSFTTGLLPAGFEAYTFPAASGSIVKSGDFNGDGLTDLLSVGLASSKRWLGLSKGDGTFDFTGRTGYDLLPSNLDAAPSSWNPCAVQVADFNGDGQLDIFSSGYGTQNDDCWLGLSKADGTCTFEYTSGSAFRVASADQIYYSNADFNGDGMPDVFGVPSSASWFVDFSKCSWVGINTNAATRLVKVIQGYRSETEHGVSTEIEYKPLTDTNIYVKGTGATWPVRDVIPSMYVVSTLWKDNGQSGTYATDYTYRSARRHYHGRGFLGFQQFESYDRQKQISTVETLAHDFPFTGRLLQRETYYIPDPLADPSDLGYAQLVTLTENDWQFDLVSGAVNTLFVFNPKSVETTWELGNTNDVVTQTTTYNWYDNQNTNSLPASSQPTNLFAKISHGNLVKSELDYGAGLKKTTANRYDDLVTPTRWLLGRLDASEVRHQAAGQQDVVRSSSFDYDAATGLLSQETIEPGDAQFELITDYYYDAFGNITNKTLTPAGLPSRTVLSVEYDSKGRFVEKSWNALEHLTTTVNDQQTGKPLSSTDPNLLSTQWNYDQTGRLIQETRPDGTTTDSTYAWDTLTVTIPPGGSEASPTVQTSIYKLTTETSGAPTVTTWFDKNGRKIRTQTESADGRPVNTDTGYNAIAQAFAVSEPYFATSGSPVYTFTQYDALSRPQLLTAPDGTKTAFGYLGLTTTVTNNSAATDGPTASRNQVAITVKNPKGELVSTTTSSVGNSLFEIQYSHDPVGNLIQTTDPASNTIQMHYDIRGNKTWQSDPDMGVWAYTYNALDQLVSQTNANSQATTMEYDLLGRMTQRTAPEGVASWFFDNPGEGGKLGAPWREEYRDTQGNLINRKTYAYDALKRPMLELQNVDDKWYYTAFLYDQFSRVKETHRFWRPQSVIASGDDLSPNWNSFASINTYNERGVVTKVEDGTGHAWWSCDEADFDARGNLLEYTQGNDVVTTRIFDDDTGRLESIGLSGLSYGLHTQTFGYDRLGNLTSRSLARTLQTTLSESFGYDALNRLVGVDNASSFVQYNALGNITKKGTVTDYAYGAYNAGPHAVTTANGISHLYDNCGNLINRTEDGSNTTAMVWTSFNKPLRIDMDASNVTSTNYSEFAYDANHNRTTQTIRNDNSLTKKLYLAGFEQTETSTNLVTPAWTYTETRVFVATPVGTIGILVQDAQENIERRYLHKDHLGSVVAVTGEPTSGGAPVLAEYSFDAWGTHRDPSDWSPLSGGSQASATSLSSDRGFTGHEMLDHLGLVHMNGRIFDSLLGRFLSPDPLIQDPENLQSFNRYSYVWNNPLTLTDPSGFKAKSKAAASITAAMESVDLSQAISSVSLSEQDNLGGETDAESSEQVNDYYSDGTNTQVDQFSRTTSDPSADPNAKNDVQGEAENKTPFEQTANGTKTGDYTQGETPFKEQIKSKTKELWSDLIDTLKSIDVKAGFGLGYRAKVKAGPVTVEAGLDATTGAQGSKEGKGVYLGGSVGAKAEIGNRSLGLHKGIEWGNIEGNEYVETPTTVGFSHSGANTEGGVDSSKSATIDVTYGYIRIGVSADLSPFFE